MEGGTKMGNDAYSATPVVNARFHSETKKGSPRSCSPTHPEYWPSGFPKLGPRRLSRHSRLDHGRQALQKASSTFRDPSRPKTEGAVRNDAIPRSSTPGWEVDYQQFNLKASRTRPTTKLVRQAISYGFDRERS